MIKRIIFLTDYPFNARDHNRFGIELLEGNGFTVEVWESTSILYPQLSSFVAPDAFTYRGLTSFSDRAELVKRLHGLTRSDFVVCFISYNYNSHWLYRALSRADVWYAVFTANNLPEVRHKALPVFLKKLTALLMPNPFRAGLSLLFQHLPSRWLGIRRADFVLAGGRKSAPAVRADKTEVIWVHALDYDIYLELLKSPTEVDSETIVFLDDNLFHDFDFMRVGISYGVPAEVYYAQLRRFFDFVEEKTSKKIIIAAHPRSNYEGKPDYFGGREIIRGRTAELVRLSSGVILQGSTSVNFAVLFRKPMIFITTRLLEKLYYGLYGKTLAGILRKRRVYIDSPFDIDIDSELKVYAEVYQMYIEDYIKTAGSPDLPFWQIVANRVKGL